MEEQKKDILWRIYIVYFGTAVFALLIFLKVIYIQVVQGEHYREMARSITTRYVDIEALRGDICAEDGRLMATSIPVYEIRMDLSSGVISAEVFNGKIDSLSYSLARLFQDRSPREYKNSLINARRNQERYYLLKRNVNYYQVNALKSFPILNLGRYKGGLIIVENKRREMPFKSLAARTIGYERGGAFVGLEGAYRDELEGIHGKRLMQKTSGGLWMPVSDQNEIDPQNGKDIITTINVNMQDVVENALKEQLEKYGAGHGTAVVMEVSTGHIKAISNLSRDEDDEYVEYFNYAVGESTEPGSTFKLASMIAALEDNLADPDDLINTGEGSIVYSDRLMKDSREEGFGIISVKNAFEVSSNVAISQIINEGYKHDPNRFINRLKAMGIDTPLGLEIKGEGKPVVNEVNSSSWSAVSLPWMAIGYEVALTPLQILAFYNAIANNGKKVKPMFVKEIRQTGRTVKKFDTQILKNQICSNSTLAKVKEMLEGVVENGTAQNIKSSSYKIAGKTGTAQVADTKFGYRRESGVVYRASFVGYFPAENPAYSMIVVVHNPKGWIYNGSQVAAPVFKKIADRIYATHIILPEEELKDDYLAHMPAFRMSNYDDLKDIYSEFDCILSGKPQRAWVQSVINKDTVVFREREFIENLVPNVVGMGLKDALYVLENANLKVKFTGKGIVRKQSIRPGVRISEGMNILIELS
ncbi:MAG: penicillin-binding protein [Bacteroidales bacterium]